jgi:hypothetical protein
MTGVFGKRGRSETDNINFYVAGDWVQVAGR